MNFIANWKYSFSYKIIFDLYFNFLIAKQFTVAKITPDKWKHFFVGIPMGATIQIFTSYIMPLHYVLSIIITFGVVCAISYGFELISLITKKGHYDIGDAIAGIAGGVIGMIIILLL